MATKQGLASFKGLKKGQKFRVIANTGSHNYEVGKVYTMNQNGTTATSMHSIATEFLGNTIYARDIELATFTLAEMEAELTALLAEHKKAVDELQRKIKFCKVNKVGEYDADIEKVYAVLNTLDSKSSKMDKAKVIAQLIKEA